ncbi:MAG TPA: CinA family protein [Terriglobia bacterium]|nr:CinA family protein [Terriglobia bacterium]
MDVPALLDLYRRRGWMVATAESCTGGLIAATLTEIAGSSDVVDRGFVTYSNEAKTDLLGVPAAMIAAHGAVSAEVAAAMARGALEHSRATVSVAVTGIAGPGGGSAEKPVGLVYIGVARRDLVKRELGDPLVERHVFDGRRHEIRLQTVARAIDLLTEAAR